MKLALPTANPTMVLPNIIPDTLSLAACHSAPPMNKRSAANMIDFRPNLSAKMPVMGEATRAPRLVHDVMRLLSTVVSERPRSSPIDTRVEEITPVLKAVSIHKKTLV